MIKRLLYSALLFFIFSLSLFFLYIYKSSTNKLSIEKNVKIIIEKTDNEQEICKKLVKKNLAKNKIVAKCALKYAEYLGKIIEAGEYRIYSTMSLNEAIEKLCSGDVVIHNIVIFRGTSANDIKQAVNLRNDLLDKITVDIKEGEIISGKYEFTYPTTKDEITAKMKAHALEKIDYEWINRSSNCVVQTKNEAIRLASIVAKEAMCNEDIPLVASVFSNRLKIGMRLQSDPTIEFFMSRENIPFQKGKLTKKDLFLHSQFNTYRNAGIPPASISTPSIKDIRAVLHPELTDHLYFLGDLISKKMYFASSYEDFLSIKKKFKENRKKRIL